MKATRLLVTAAVAVVLLPGCGSSYGDDKGGGTSSAPIRIMFGSSGEAETGAVKKAAAVWQKKTGHKVQVVPAQNLAQQLTQGFAGGNPPDVFYTDPTVLQQYADGGSLYPYGDQLPKSTVDDFYPALRQADTYKGKLYCAPKDLDTHELVINTDLWKAAGLTEADYPKTWDDLTRVATKLTNGKHVGLTVGGDHNTVGTFMLGAGGWFVNKDNSKVTANSPENLKALNYLRDNMKKKIFATPKSINAQNPGEAFGKGRAAMDVDGGWIIGQLSADYPDVHWTAVPMPAGPAGQATTVFTNCWGIAAKSPNRKAAVDLVKTLTSVPQQKNFMTAFGATPSRQSLADWTVQANPKKDAFVRGAKYARGVVSIPGFSSVLADFDTQLEKLFTGGTNAKDALDSLQRNGDDALKQK
ncbi:MAG: sugar ABC transporter substrate-binding protein [Actinocatenispora sp.]